MALPGKSYDGHTLATFIPHVERTIGNGIARILADAGYRGHNAPLSHKFRVFTSGQKRCMTPAIKREMRRRAAVEPVICHIKNGHRMNRNYLAGPKGDAINAVLAATGYSFRLLLNWLRLLLCLDCQPDPAALIQRKHTSDHVKANCSRRSVYRLPHPHVAFYLGGRLPQQPKKLNYVAVTPLRQWSDGNCIRRRYRAVLLAEFNQTLTITKR
jgi:hypothetical protein